MVVEGLGLGITFAFGVHDLLFGQTDEQFVGVLRVADRNHVGRVNLVQDGDFGIHVRVGGERVILQALDGGLHSAGVGAEAANRLDAVPVRPVGEFDRGVAGFDPLKLIGGDIGESGAIVGQLLDGLDRIIDNLRGLGQLKQRLRSTTPKVSLWITGLKSNIAELPALVRLAHDIGVREVYLQRLVYSGRGLAVQDEALFRQAEETELIAVREAEHLATELGIELKGSGEASAAEMVAGEEAATTSYKACRRPWSLMYVTANGNVLPCCIAPFTGAHYEGIVLGNIFETTAEEIWNGQQYQQWRRGMLSGDPPEACVGCGAGWSL